MRVVIRDLVPCLVLIAGALAACGGPVVRPSAPAEVKAEAPTLEFRGIQFEKESFLGEAVQFAFELVSRDSKPARGSSCPWSLELKDLATQQGSQPLEGELAPGGRLPVKVRIPLPWPESVEEIKVLLGRKNIPYKFQLTCQLEGAGGSLTAANSDKGSIPLPRLPQVDVLQANAERFGGDEARITFELGMVNENEFNLKVNKIIYRVYLEDTLVTEGELPVVEVLPPSNEASYDVTTPIFTSDKDRAVLALLRRPQINYRLEGSVQLGEFDLPLNARGTISFGH